MRIEHNGAKVRGCEGARSEGPRVRRPEGGLDHDSSDAAKHRRMRTVSISIRRRVLGVIAVLGCDALVEMPVDAQAAAGSSVTGTIKFEATAPRPQRLRMTSDPLMRTRCQGRDLGNTDRREGRRHPERVRLCEGWTPGKTFPPPQTPSRSIRRAAATSRTPSAFRVDSRGRARRMTSWTSGAVGLAISSRAITNRRPSSAVLTATSGSTSPSAGSARRSPNLTTVKVVIGRGTPSSKTSNSSCVRFSIGSPRRSSTTTSSATASMPERNVGTAAGFCCALPAPVVNRASNTPARARRKTGRRSSRI